MDVTEIRTSSSVLSTIFNFYLLCSQHCIAFKIKVFSGTVFCNCSSSSGFIFIPYTICCEFCDERAVDGYFLTEMVWDDSILCYKLEITLSGLETYLSSCFSSLFFFFLLHKSSKLIAQKSNFDLW